ncbi:lipopolysaccharide biosynthesis protein [Erwinia aphidicola]|uniref:lipopolysaccharide biosynthesis protein n=1 Tax=Erwinia aphidicola TaxID=68334 RepID=UPI0030D36004
MKKQLTILLYVYGVRIYTAIVSIVIIPYIIKLVGFESYGLVGFYAVLLACLNILDAGIGGVLTRQAIISRSSRINFDEFIGVFNKVIKLFILIGITVAIVGSYLSYHYGKSWLKTSLSTDDISLCISLMFCIFAVRYLQGPYRSLLLSNESQITISSINLVYVTLSQPITLILLYFVHRDIKFYFFVQMFAAVINTILMIYYGEKIKRIIRSTLPDGNDAIGKLSLRSILMFAMQLSVISVMWIIVNQSDKLALTKFIELSEYAKYSVAVSVSALIFIISDPLNQVLLPKLTRYYNEKNMMRIVSVLPAQCLFVCLCLIPLSMFLFFNGTKLLYVWSGEQELSIGAGKYLPWIFLGGIFGVFSNFCFLLRYSSGELKKHTIVYCIFGIIVVPLNVFIASKYHGIGAAIFFSVSSSVLFITWSGYNFHKYFYSGTNFIFKIMVPLFIGMYAFFYMLSNYEIKSDNRALSLFFMLVEGVGGVVIAAVYIILVKDRLNVKLRMN